MKKTKLLYIGDAVSRTGFSRVGEGILLNLPKEEYEISVLGVNFYGDPHTLPYRVYPAGSKGDMYGYNRLGEILTKEQPDIIFLLNDAWILNDYLKVLKQTFIDNRPRIVTYIPVDAKDHLKEWYQNFDIVDAVVAYTEFGRKEIEKVLPDRPIGIIPHGVDSDIFFKISMPKKAIKSKVWPKNPELADSFIVFNGNRNQPRKRLDIAMRAFKLFSEGKPDNVKFYAHCGLVDASINIAEMSERLDLGQRLIITTASNGIQQIPENRLNLVYNACDIGVNTSLGEGWGLVNIEHLITGAPQVVPENSANIELYEDCGLLVPTVTDWTLDNLMTTGSVVRPEDVAERFEQLYVDEQLYNSLSNKGLNKFLSPEYSWKKISEKWSDIFHLVVGN